MSKFFDLSNDSCENIELLEESLRDTGYMIGNMKSKYVNKKLNLELDNLIDEIFYLASITKRIHTKLINEVTK